MERIISHLEGHRVDNRLYEYLAKTIMPASLAQEPDDRDAAPSFDDRIMSTWSRFIGLRNKSGPTPRPRYETCTKLCESALLLCLSGNKDIRGIHALRGFLEMSRQPERIHYKRLLKTAMQIDDRSIRAPAVAVLLFCSTRARYWLSGRPKAGDTALCCKLFRKGSGHRAVEVVGSSYLCECFVPGEYKAVVDFVVHDGSSVS